MCKGRGGRTAHGEVKLVLHQRTLRQDCLKFLHSLSKCLGVLLCHHYWNMKSLCTSNLQYSSSAPFVRFG